MIAHPDKLLHILRKVLYRNFPPQIVRAIVRKAEHLMELPPLAGLGSDGLDHVAVCDTPVLHLHRNVFHVANPVQQPRPLRVQANALPLKQCP